MLKTLDGVLVVPVSLGDLADKITILRIKAARLTDPQKLANVALELDSLERIFAGGFPILSDEVKTAVQSLQEVNERLWVIEDEIRECERDSDFGPRFVALARSVYRTNDERARLKRDINVLLGSKLIEEKSYAGDLQAVAGER